MVGCLMQKILYGQLEWATWLPRNSLAARCSLEMSLINVKLYTYENFPQIKINKSFKGLHLFLGLKTPGNSRIRPTGGCLCLVESTTVSHLLIKQSTVVCLTDCKSLTEDMQLSDANPTSITTKTSVNVCTCTQHAKHIPVETSHLRTI